MFEAVFETPSFTGKSFGWESQVLGGCFTIMMCNECVWGQIFGGRGGGVLGGCFQINVSVFSRELQRCLKLFSPSGVRDSAFYR